MDPTISVIIPTYNDEEYIYSCIQSILDQNMPKVEILIVDGGSTDNTCQEINRLNSEKIKTIECGDLVPSLNKGIQIANGKFIARVDADTTSDSTRFRKQLEHFEKYGEDLAGVGTACINIRNNSKELVVPPSKNNEIKNRLLYENPMIHPSMMFRKAALLDVGGYLDYHWEDYELYTRLIEAGYQLRNLSDPLIKHHIRDTGIYNNTNKFKAKFENIRCRILALYRVLPN